MSQDYRQLNVFPIIKNFNAIQTWTDVIVPPKGRIVTIGCEQHDIYVSVEGTEGGATAGVNKMFIKAGGYVVFNLQKCNFTSRKNRTTEKSDTLHIEEFEGDKLEQQNLTTPN